VSSIQKKVPLRVILDSNAFFIPLQFRLDIFGELRCLLNRNIECILLSTVKEELGMLSQKGAPQTRRNALFALKLSEKCTFIKIDSEKSLLVDDVIVRVAKDWNYPVFTNDTRLRRKLRDISVPVIYVRQKSHLEIDGLI
jgi:uncharacterized protein